MNADETMKNALREAMLGPSVLLLALSAISTGTGCQASASSPSQPRPGVPTPIAATTGGIEAPGPTEALAPTEAPVTASPFVVTASAVQTAPGAGEPLDITIEVKNTGDTAQTLHFTSGQQFDVEAFKPGEKTSVWQWSADYRFIQVLRDKVVAPGASLSYKAKWPAPPAGKFSMQAKVTANGGLKAAPFDVTIGPAKPAA